MVVKKKRGKVSGVKKVTRKVVEVASVQSGGEISGVEGVMISAAEVDMQEHIAERVNGVPPVAEAGVTVSVVGDRGMMAVPVLPLVAYNPNKAEVKDEMVVGELVFECGKCRKVLRREGLYVNKTGRVCPKCNEPMLTREWHG